MKATESIEAQTGRCRAHCAASAWIRAGVVVLPLIGLGSACLAADTTSGLGSAFRPQGVADVPPEGGRGERAGGSPAGLRVVVSSASRSVASIDGQIVHVGDTVNGMRVTQINAQGVVLKGEGGVSESLMVTPSVVKRRHLVRAARISNGDRQ